MYSSMPLILIHKKVFYGLIVKLNKNSIYLRNQLRN